MIKSYNKNIEFIGNHFNSGVKIGKGKFGKVYKGYHVLTALPVAIKIIDWKHHSQNKQPAQVARAKKQVNGYSHSFLRLKVTIMFQQQHKIFFAMYLQTVDQRNRNNEESSPRQCCGTI